MNRSAKIALVVMTGIALTTGAAMARQGWMQPNGPRHGMGPGMDQGPERLEQLYMLYDTNKDGKITQDEVNAARTAILADADTDKSGSLNIAEFQNAWLKLNNLRMVRDFQRLDVNGDGQVTKEEFDQPVTGIVSRLDRNNDQALTQDEMHGKHRGMNGEPGMQPPPPPPAAPQQ
jgi:Ca2+-binding EF-hand superfamily protein